ncbi:histidine kinase [Aureimonas sp. Leaf454]|uniref:hybrid sensor histidine kinase/response regulator n=1 Tax=Aureimonas sp. Leaf454 TaxID=1736381 RepID=UPI0006F5DA52|nr:PAS domain-containing hybrid sensor histidine kinase/response regulator [Aureimonas sp. Leaf454]KQT54498.1 histidine kinase [Aureimonas sp. Leaf454]
MQSWIIGAAAVAYLLILFAVAHLGDRRTGARSSSAGRPGVYALSLAVYCTSWTFFGSVGVAARDGFAFLAIYCGPIVVFVVATPLLERIIALAKAEKITTIADFIGSRYGKSTSVAAIAAVIALIGAVPYIALQLKAVSSSVATIAHYRPGTIGTPPFFGDIALYVALALGAFAILFGTRHADATEHQNGLVLAIALESIVKLAAFLAVGLWVTFSLFGPAELWRQAFDSPEIAAAFSGGLDGRFVASAILSAFAIVLLPRQFHVTVVENRTRAEIRRARWLFPLYLVAINLFVLPVAAAGLIRLGPGAEADFFVLALPLSAGHDILSLVAFIGGLSAATAMVIVACVALSIMISNDLVLPLLLQQSQPASEADATRLILKIRRSAILSIVLLGYLYHRLTGGGSALASIGLLSFAAIAQFAPSVFLGLLWKGANARGAKAGLLSGIGAWAYTLLLPAILPGSAFVESGPLGWNALRPEALLGLDLDPLMHGVFVSLALNAAALVVGSLTRASSPRERIQASIFVRPDGAGPTAFRRSRADVTVGELKATIARYLGQERTERSFQTLEADERRTFDDATEADARVIGFSEQLLGSAIGSASSRLVLSLLLQRHKGSSRSAIRLLDDASEALQYNRDILRIALDQVDQGLAVFDVDLRLTVWNRQLRDLLDLAPQFGQVGTPLTAILGQLRAHGEIDEAELHRSFEVLTQAPALRQISLMTSERVIEIRTNAMPGGGLVLTVSDMTERVRRAAALRDVNETLEERVRQRTAELVRANDALGEARRIAEAANLGKTRFLAAAGHDILQPLNAARLYAAALQERHATLPGAGLAANINSSIESVEAILGAVLDISRLDAGGMTSRPEDVPLQPLLSMIETDLAPLALAKGVRLRFVPTTATVRSDRNLLRRLLQNLVSNAVKYTKEGKVVVGVRRDRDNGTVDISVVDSGIGIPGDQLETIFQEFIRLDEGTRTADGLGLGLSIVDRIARVLDHPVSVTSEHGRGTRFRVTLPKVSSRPASPARAPTTHVHRALRLDGMRVLVVDNEAAIRSGMQVLLTGWNCRVDLAASPAEAMERACAASLDIVLVDYHLGEANGVDVVAELRRRIDPGLPAILITADRSAALRETAAAAGIDLLTKPVKPASLRAAMAQGRGRRVAAE